MGTMCLSGVQVLGFNVAALSRARICQRGWVLIFMLKVLIVILPTSMSPSTSMPPSRRGHGWFLMLMGSPLMLEISPKMGMVFFLMLWVALLVRSGLILMRTWLFLMLPPLPPGPPLLRPSPQNLAFPYAHLLQPAPPLPPAFPICLYLTKQNLACTRTQQSTLERNIICITA